jgi:hypothetical protein
MTHLLPKVIEFADLIDRKLLTVNDVSFIYLLPFYFLWRALVFLFLFASQQLTTTYRILSEKAPAIAEVLADYLFRKNSVGRSRRIKAYGELSMGIEIVAFISANAFSMNIQTKKDVGKGINWKMGISCGANPVDFWVEGVKKDIPWKRSFVDKLL